MLATDIDFRERTTDLTKEVPMAHRRYPNLLRGAVQSAGRAFQPLGEFSCRLAADMMTERDLYNVKLRYTDPNIKRFATTF